jgi:DNA-binding transcriptional LysR family regulator
MTSIRTLKTFLAVVKYRSFAAAGDKIGLTAAAVGLQMRTLEKDLNVVLFDRGGRSVVLNTAGRNMVGKIEDLVLRYEALTDNNPYDELSGTIVMGALVSALMGSFADALWNLKQQCPRLDVKLFAGMSSDFADRIQQGELDAAIVTQSPRLLPSTLIWTPLYTEPMVLIAPRRPHFPMPADPMGILRESPFIRFDRKSWTGHLVKDVLQKGNIEVVEDMELNSIEAIIEIVRQGFGVSIVPQLANVHWARDRALKVIPIPGVEVNRHVGLLERAQHTRMQVTHAIKVYFQTHKHKN